MKAKNRSIKHPSLGEGLGGLPRSSLERPHYPGWPREHYNKDRTEKRPLKSFKEARRTARRLFLETGEYYSAYRCQYCGYWHVGHNESLPQRERIYVLNGKIDLESKILRNLKAEVEVLGTQLSALTTKIIDTERTIIQHCQELADIKAVNN